ncbi:hypothetical protein PanWU01x14_193980 [Parasponia andersonii]|uniref:Uncharacterized protein n=1 Tax=Parasponia andersonii TaxID=3476 RepID=A0A2P5C0S8_PARAD|nr:hypothetical protein PanWU01x14_193980 [Parasponia andersonii]
MKCDHQEARRTESNDSILCGALSWYNFDEYCEGMNSNKREILLDLHDQSISEMNEFWILRLDQAFPGQTQAENVRLSVRFRLVLLFGLKQIPIL